MRKSLSLLCLALLTAASAPKYQGSWTASVPDQLSQSMTLDRGDYKKVGQAFPLRLFELSGNAAVEKTVIGYLSRGTLMVPVDESLSKFCRLVRHEGSAFGCLADTNGDGSLDQYFGAQVFKEFFTGSVGDEGGREPLISPVNIVEVRPVQRAPDIDLEFMYRGRNKKNDISYSLCLSKKIEDGKTFYQSTSRKGFSVVCSRFLSEAFDGSKPLRGLGMVFDVHEITDKTIKLTPRNAEDSSFKTSSGFG